MHIVKSDLNILNQKRYLEVSPRCEFAPRSKTVLLINVNQIKTN